MVGGNKDKKQEREDNSMKREDIKKLFEQLAQSQGFYGRFTLRDNRR